jgi:uncharacterized membrane protein YkvA (DUF1232 family)
VRWLLIGLGAVLVVWLAAIALLLWRGRTTLARELVTFIPNVLRLFHGLLRDPRVPGPAKLALLVGVVWLASPIDLIPEFLPGVGALDDAIVAGLVLRYLVRTAGVDVVRDHWRGDPRTLGLVLRAAGR